MRTWTIIPLLGAALIALALPPAEARSMHGRSAISRHVRFATPGHFVIVLNPNIRGRVLFNRSFGRFVAFDHRGFAGSRWSTPFGFPFGLSYGLGGFDGFTDFGSRAVMGTAPSTVVLAAPQPAPLQLSADLAPCHETSPVGVIIERGTACSWAVR
jgi:hypothetical protein